MIDSRRRISLGALTAAFCLLLAAAACMAADQAELAALTKDITSEEATTRTQAFEKLLAMGRAGAEGLLAMLVEQGKGDDAGARFALHGMAVRLGGGGAEKERGEFATVLSGYLRSDAAAEPKRFVIAQLQNAGGAESVPSLADCLSDDELADAACHALTANSSAEASKALRDALPEAPAALQVSIIQALGERRDAEAVPLLLKEAEAQDMQVRLAALAALGAIGDPSAEPVIVAALGRGDERETRVAFDAYLQLGDQLREASDRDAAAALYARAFKAAPSSESRAGALIGMGTVGSASDVAIVAPYLDDPDPVIAQAARVCLVEMPGSGPSSALARLLKTREPSAKVVLLEVLAQRDDPEAKAALEAATRDRDPAVRVTAYQLLGRADDEADANTLMSAAARGSDAIHSVALEAYMRQAERRVREGQSATARLMYERALEVGRTDAVRAMALRGLATVPDPASLAKVNRLLQNEAVRADALRAYLAIASTMEKAGHTQQAVQMYRRVAEMQVPRDVGLAALTSLRGLGVEADPARGQGFVTAWWFMGPYPSEAIRDTFPPEDGVDVGRAIRFGDRELHWIRYRTREVMGVVNLAELMLPRERVTGYLYAEVTVEKEQDVLLKMGSDDGMKCWLNGRVIHSHPEARSLTVDEDAVETRLAAGVNKILLKVVNGGGGWECCLRITDRQGQPISFTQREL